MKLLLALFILIASPVFAADVYEKVDDKTVRVVTQMESKIDIEAVISNRTSLQTACTEQLAEYDRQIGEAKKVGVE